MRKTRLREKFYPEKKSTLEKVHPGKNPQFLSNHYETWWKYSSHECFKFLQYQLDSIKIVDFLVIAKFMASPDNYATPSSYFVIAPFLGS